MCRHEDDGVSVLHYCPHCGVVRCTKCGREWYSDLSAPAECDHKWSYGKENEYFIEVNRDE
jgi:hypothetical protein